jgi:site-specific DNA recombinase
LEKTEFEPRIRTAKGSLAVLETDLQRSVDEEEQRRSLRSVIGRMREFTDSVTDSLANADWLTRGALIRAVVKRIEIADNDVRIVYKISPDAPTGQR